MIAPKVYAIIKLPYIREMNKRIPIEYFVIPDKNKKFMVYFPLKGVISQVNKSFVDKINTRDCTVRALFNLAEKQKTVKIELEPPNNKNALILDLTNDCNLKCIYCYAHGGDNPKYMTWEIAKTAIDYQITRCKDKNFFLEFHGGGEPLMAFNMMKKCYEYAKEKCDKKKIEITPFCTTNGTLITKDVAKWFKKINIVINLSFDGLPELQNKQRPFRDGSGSCEAVVRTIKLLNKYCINFKINTTVTKNTTNKMNEIAKNLHKLNVKNWVVFYAHECGRCLKTNTVGPDYQNFRKQFIKTQKLAEKYKINFVDHGKVKPDFGYIYKYFCRGCGSFFLVTARGDITSCFTILDKNDPASKTFFYGKIENDKVIINKKKLEYLRRRTVDNMKECEKCFAKYLCSGGCLVESIKDVGSLYKPSEKECLKNRYKYKSYFTDLFKQQT